MTLKRPSETLLERHKELCVLLDFGFVMIVLTADPDIKTSGLHCAFAACHCDGPCHLESRNRSQSDFIANEM